MFTIRGIFMIFLDTGYFRGLMNPKDSHHDDALNIREFINEINETTVINTTVIVETLNRAVWIEDNIKSLYNNLIEENLVVN